MWPRAALAAACACALAHATALLPAASLAHAAPPPRRALFWLEPYANVTSVDGYAAMWRQWAAGGPNWRAGHIAAGSAFAVKRNGTVGFADTAAGEGLEGVLMARYGFPALRSAAVNVSTVLALVYVTHYQAIAKIVAQPAAFVTQMVSIAEQYQLDGFDLDYEPQQWTAGALWGAESGAAPARAEEEGEWRWTSRAERAARRRQPQPALSAAQQAILRELTASFMAVVGQLAAALAPSGRIVTIDVSGCPSSDAFDCAGAGAAGLAHVNTMDAFGAASPGDLQALEPTDAAPLGPLWSPGFEPGNVGQAGFAAMAQYMAGKPALYRGLATWEVHECNVGPQPQWLFDAVNAFLDAP